MLTPANKAVLCLPPAVLCLTDSVEQFSSAAVLQEEVHSRTFLPMAKETYDVGVVETLPNRRKHHILNVKVPLSLDCSICRNLCSGFSP